MCWFNASFEATVLPVRGQGEPLFHELVVFPAPRNPGWLTTTKERITLYRGLYNLKRWTAANNLAELVVKLYAPAHADAPEDVDGGNAGEEAGPDAVGGEVPNAVDDVVAGEAVAPRAADAEIDDDMADFLM